LALRSKHGKSHSGHGAAGRVGAVGRTVTELLTIEQNKALAMTPTQELLKLPSLQLDQVKDSLVMGTGHHAALRASVRAGKVAAVVGDGAVGPCGVIAARRLGAEQIIMLGRHTDRIALGR